MTEETIFTQALTKRNAADRAAFLDEACEGNDTLRRQVDELLRSHEEGGSYLEVPAVFQIRPSEVSLGRQTEPTGGTLPLVSAQASAVSTPETSTDSRDDGLTGDVPLDFLDPPTKPGSLGRLGHYEVTEVVGRGGMGVVLRAFDTKLHRVVAIKVMAAELAANATARRRFTREARAAAAVCHEHVVTIHSVDEEHRPPYLVMQFVEGVSLQERLDHNGVPGLREILRIGLQTAEGLAAAHKQGLVHRDIKPANILLENGVERVKITDFGLARAADDASLTQSGVIAGTPQYMSPEQAEGAAVDQRTDLFSLGSVLYATCTGRAPFRGSSNVAVLKRVVEETPQPIRELNPDIPEWLCELIVRLQAKEPGKRPASADEVATILARRLSELQQPRHTMIPDYARTDSRTAIIPTLSPPSRAVMRSPKRRPARLVTIAGVALAVLLAIGWSATNGVPNLVGTVIRLIRPEGTLVIEAAEPGMGVRLDGGDIVIVESGIQEFRLRAGSHDVETHRGDELVGHDVIEIERGGRKVVRVSTAPTDAAAIPMARSPVPRSMQEDWADSVFHLPLNEQVKAVSAKLKDLNPGFDGRVDATYDAGTVYKVTFCTDNVRDISPLRGLRELFVLDAKGSDHHRGRLSDIGPLRELRRLTVLQLMNNDVKDLTPLKGLRLSYIGFGFNPVEDLTPLAGMPVETAQLWNTNVRDISPLSGMPIRDLHLVATHVRELSPLRGAPLEKLAISFTEVQDLSPLRGLPLYELAISGTKVKDLDVLEGMRLKQFEYSTTELADISVLKPMPVEEVVCNFQPKRDAAILRFITTLRRINGKPAPDFWKEFDARPAALIPH